MSGWIGVDLDATLARYDGWMGVEHIGEPIAPMVERVKRWIAQGCEVRIFTARVDGMGDQNGVAHRDIPMVRQHIEQWCLEHVGKVLPITNVKDYGMIELWDDRAVQVEANTGRILGARAGDAQALRLLTEASRLAASTCTRRKSCCRANPLYARRKTFSITGSPK